ncbi:E3 ubiquitin-protein ligase PRT1 [Curcuma longa]|uniref:E3 ubiquitin-protein ligase PRT1 n=1 Tax=Curcuma longa TaxID=136217 RepID=UPI003D9F882C
MADAEVPNPVSSPAVADPAESGSSSPFECCVCLDLLYKPVVLACGHTSCFWCVNKAMHGFRASYCPICRQPYYHFPNICQLLHYLLLKLEPEAYKRREMEVFEEEKSADIYSPQLVDQLCEKKLNSGRASSSENVDDSRHIELVKLSSPEQTMKRSISVVDVLCSLCKEMIYKPMVLNCGHVYCETCLYGLSRDPLRCQICKSLHPGEFPNVCLDLHHFLEEAFPTEYAVRREQVHLEKTNAVQIQNLKAKIPSETKDLWFNQDMHDIHVGIGCDSCGLYPIAGKRYRCKDCKEAVGFDLCETCYNTTSKLPGRFNQQHTPEHKFELDQSRTLRNIFLSQANNTMEIPPEAFDEDDAPVADTEHVYQNHDDPGPDDFI